MISVTKMLTRNWGLKIISLLLATGLWAAIANETSSEIRIDLPLEYRNVPRELEITGETTNLVAVRLRGSSNLIKGIASRDVAAVVDLGGVKAGERLIMLTPRNVEAPFGAEVSQIQPSRIRVSLERTVSRTVPISPTIEGRPASGFEVTGVSVSPPGVSVEGPESHVSKLKVIPTVPIQIDGLQASALQSIDLDMQDSYVRIQNSSAVDIRIEIRRK